MIEEISPLPLGEGQGEGFATRHYAYDAAGRLVQMTDRDGRVTTYDYDALGRLLAENWLDGSEQVVYTISYTYDAVGDLLTASDDAATYEYDYDALGRLTGETQTIAGLTPVVEFAYQYDAAGNRLQSVAMLDSVADAVTNYAYDALNRLARIEQFGAVGGNAVADKRIDFTYDAASRYSTIVRYADLAATQEVATAVYTFDDINRLKDLVYTQPNSTGLPYYHYDYNAVNMTALETIDGTVDYTHDNTDQLTGADYDYQTDENYQYDSNGNRTNTGYTTGPNNQLLTSSDGVTTYTYEYDAEGNRVLRYVDVDADQTFDAGDTDATAYTWDHRNRLTEVEHFTTYANYDAGTSDLVVDYTYDCFNRLIARTLDADGTSGATSVEQSIYVYEDGQIVAQFDKTGEGDLSTTDLSHRYLWNPQAADQLFADEQVHWDEQAEDFITDDLLWALTDNINSVRDLATYDSGNDDTTVVTHRIFDAFGNKTETGTAACDFGFTGKLFDEYTGLQNNWNNWYDAKTARWLGEDKAFSDPNLYRYVGNAPLTNVDPLGLCKEASNNEDKSKPDKADTNKHAKPTVVDAAPKPKDYKSYDAWTKDYFKYRRKLSENDRHTLDNYGTPVFDAQTYFQQKKVAEMNAERQARIMARQSRETGQGQTGVKQGSATSTMSRWYIKTRNGRKYSGSGGPSLLRALKQIDKDGDIINEMVLKGHGYSQGITEGMLSQTKLIEAFENGDKVSVFIPTGKDNDIEDVVLLLNRITGAHTKIYMNACTCAVSAQALSLALPRVQFVQGCDTLALGIPGTYNAISIGLGLRNGEGGHWLRFRGGIQINGIFQSRGEGGWPNKPDPNRGLPPGVGRG